jgi:hypothetical protein
MTQRSIPDADLRRALGPLPKRDYATRAAAASREAPPESPVPAFRRYRQCGDCGSSMAQVPRRPRPVWLCDCGRRDELHSESVERGAGSVPLWITTRGGSP